MKNVSDIVAAIGRSHLREVIGVTDTAISNALSKGAFPPGWYRIIKLECAAKQVSCPLDLFAFKPHAKIKVWPSDADNYSDTTGAAA
ncbi:hypothetical protein AN189_17985 [Loktanella sp. 3ANDIMAR09]|uniref:hypothetical protein n=1 Tax=Loktanella sp. 3ANDIMAR09 TaxID=1225657 RepID=UPI0006F4072A|nr:hypothetical protein [Loktanella sp. 3ANDIMAR09]KQI66948.1 hypothetical protein AN189_17985 [Loktanella sp. 3ANDIMAR09]